MPTNRLYPCRSESMTTAFTQHGFSPRPLRKHPSGKLALKCGLPRRVQDLQAQGRMGVESSTQCARVKPAWVLFPQIEWLAKACEDARTHAQTQTHKHTHTNTHPHPHTHTHTRLDRQPQGQTQTRTRTRTWTWTPIKLNTMMMDEESALAMAHVV